MHRASCSLTRSCVRSTRGSAKHRRVGPASCLDVRDHGRRQIVRGNGRDQRMSPRTWRHPPGALPKVSASDDSLRRANRRRNHGGGAETAKQGRHRGDRNVPRGTLPARTTWTIRSSARRRRSKASVTEALLDHAVKKQRCEESANFVVPRRPMSGCRRRSGADGLSTSRFS